MSDNPIELYSPNQKLKGLIDLNGGMLATVQLKRECNGTERWLDLLHKAPWLSEDYFNQKADLLGHLSGEWACVPFGWIAQDNELFKANAAHGLPCYGTWSVKNISQAKDSITIVFNYPQDYPLEKIERTVTFLDDKVNLSFTVTSRKDINVPMGAHPCFPLDDNENKLELSIHGDGMVYATEVEAGVSRCVAGAHFCSLEKIPLLQKWQHRDGNGEFYDATKLPVSYKTEEIVQMLHPQGRAVLNYVNKKLRLTLLWDSEKIPNCLLWMSQYGRDYEPWDGKNRCLGIEPICSAWDFAALSNEENAINYNGVATSVPLKQGVPFTFDYAIEVEDLS